MGFTMHVNDHLEILELEKLLFQSVLRVSRRFSAESIKRESRLVRVIFFDFTDVALRYYLEILPQGVIKLSKHIIDATPMAHIQLSLGTFQSIVQGALPPVRAFIEGKVRIEGVPLAKLRIVVPLLWELLVVLRQIYPTEAEEAVVADVPLHRPVSFSARQVKKFLHLPYHLLLGFCSTLHWLKMKKSHLRLLNWLEETWLEFDVEMEQKLCQPSDKAISSEPPLTAKEKETWQPEPEMARNQGNTNRESGAPPASQVPMTTPTTSTYQTPSPSSAALRQQNEPPVLPQLEEPDDSDWEESPDESDWEESPGMTRVAAAQPTIRVEEPEETEPELADTKFATMQSVQQESLPQLSQAAPAAIVAEPANNGTEAIIFAQVSPAQPNNERAATALVSASFAVSAHPVEDAEDTEEPVIVSSQMPQHQASELVDTNVIFDDVQPQAENSVARQPEVSETWDEADDVEFAPVPEPVVAPDNVEFAPVPEPVVVPDNVEFALASEPVVVPDNISTIVSPSSEREPLLATPIAVAPIAVAQTPHGAESNGELPNQRSMATTMTTAAVETSQVAAKPHAGFVKIKPDGESHRSTLSWTAPVYQAWSDSEVRNMVEMALCLLDAEGAAFHSAEARQSLKRIGCRGDGIKIKFPAQIVRELVQSLLGKQQEVTIVAGDNCWPRLLDFERRTSRDGSSDDVKMIIRLFNALPNLTVVNAGIIPFDVPREAADVVNTALLCQYSQKPFFQDIYSIESAKIIIKMLTIAVADKPWQMALRLQTSDPLCYAEDKCGLVNLWSKSHLPIALTAAPPLGQKLPLNITQAIVLMTAEWLAGLVYLASIAHQDGILLMARPILRFEEADRLVSPELVSIAIGMQQIAKFLDYPCNVGSGYANPSWWDFLTAWDKGMTTAKCWANNGGADDCGGSLGENFSPEQLVLDNYSYLAFSQLQEAVTDLKSPSAPDKLIEMINTGSFNQAREADATHGTELEQMICNAGSGVLASRVVAKIAAEADIGTQLSRSQCQELDKLVQVRLQQLGE